MSAQIDSAALARTGWLDVLAIVVCTAAWGTTWYAITLQLGVVDPVVSVVYRFALAGVIILLWSLTRGQSLALTPTQHLWACLTGLAAFALNYPLVYIAEQWVTSAVVAVVYAAMAFANLAAFRLSFGQRASPQAWFASALGIAGVALMSWSELMDRDLDASTLWGLGLAAAGVIAAVTGNVFARRGEQVETPLIVSTGWAMLYGALALFVFCLLSERTFTFEWSLRYVASLAYLALIGSVVAFLFYYALARRRGFAVASYVPALVPIVAMAVSSLLEAKNWGALAFAGVGLVLLGQWLLLRTRKS